MTYSSTSAAVDDLLLLEVELIVALEAAKAALEDLKEALE